MHSLFFIYEKYGGGTGNNNNKNYNKLFSIKRNELIVESRKSFMVVTIKKISQ